LGPPPLALLLPNTLLGKHPPKRSRRANASFSFSASVSNATFRCKLDSKPLRVCRSPLVLRRLKPGRHLLEVAAVDATGQVDPTPQRFRWTVAPPKSNR
jgi:hypothetical protein